MGYDEDSQETTRRIVPPGNIERAPSPIQEHFTQMESQVAKLERIQHKLEVMLDNLRGPFPEKDNTVGVDRPPPSCIIEHLRGNDDRINLLINKIETQISALEEVF